jgi:hypothetical protein
MDLEEERIRERIRNREIALREKVEQLKQRLERIKRMSDVKAMVQQRPGLMVAGSVLTGYLVRKLTARRPDSRASRGAQVVRAGDYAHSAEPPRRSSGKVKEHLTAILAGVASRTAMNVLSELGKQMIPRRTDVRRAERNFRRIR